MNSVIRISVTLMGLVVIGQDTFAQGLVGSEDCGPLENAYGPYDYSNPVDKREHLPIVEEYHLNTDVLQLRRGMTAESPRGDLEYTLRAFPNHYLALDAMARLHRREKAETLPGGRYSISCWFDRARRFAPNDATIPLIEGVHNFMLGRYARAEEDLTRSIALAPDSAEAHYNLGLLYVRLDKLEQARAEAKVAYDLGFPLSGLRDQLAQRGAWKTAENSTAD